MKEHVPYYLQHQYNLYNREKKSGIKYSCNNPEKILSIDHEGNCFVCSCDGWLPISVGHIMEFDKIEDVWQSPVAKQLQKDIIEDRNFTHCSVDYCGIKEYNCVSNDYFISINIDESCNLQCPSCRSKFINFTKGPIYEKKLVWAQHISKLLEEFKKPSTIVMSGNGDPFASLIYRPILLNTVPYKDHRYKIMTNGLLLDKLLKKTSIYPNIREISVSVDAGDKETYEQVRLKGSWEVLMNNFNFLQQELTSRPDIHVNVNFCFQRNNYKSLENFVKLIEQYKWQGTVHPFENWSTFDNFDYHNVLDERHTLYHEAVEILNLSKHSPCIRYNGTVNKIIKNSFETDKK